MKTDVLPGLWVYWAIEVSVLEIYGHYHLPFCKEVLTRSGVSILKLSGFKYLFSQCRSRIGLHLLLGFGTKQSVLKKARDVQLLTFSEVFFWISACNASIR